MSDDKRLSSLFSALALFATLVVLAGCQPADPEAVPDGQEAGGSAEQRVVVYTSRQPHLIELLFQRYTQETGVSVEFTSANEASLIERMAAEGDQTPADVFITVDAGNLWFASERGLLQSLGSESLEAIVPASLRDTDNRWFGLSVRARTLMYHPDRVDLSELSTFEDLADPKWAARLCLRTSRKVYNQSLVAMLIEHHGEEKTQTIVEGWVSNLATDPFSSDTQLIEAVAAGQCDVAIANTYYLGRLLAEDPSYPVALFWANQDTTGVHVNISGAGVTTHAPRPNQGRRLIEWLASEQAQAEFAKANLEYPVNPNVPPSGIVAQWGQFVADETPLVVVGERQAQAVRLMDRAGYR